MGRRRASGDSRHDSLRIGLLVAFLAVLLWSGVHPKDRFTWVLEVAPAVIGAGILVATHRRFPFTPLACVLMFVHAAILCVGGHYTYAEVPLGDWVRDALHLSRNHYDRVGHFAQGFVPAIAAREVLIRTSPLGVKIASTRGERRSRWLFFLVVCFCLALSAAYELIEWSVAALTGEAADAFLGTQGDVWDTQKDMALALIGSIVALLTLPRLHDRQLSRNQSFSAAE